MVESHEARNSNQREETWVNTIYRNTSRIFGIFVLGNRARCDKDEFHSLDLEAGLGFVLVHYSWAGVLPLSVANIWSITPLEKTDFFLCLWLSISDGFLVRNGELCSLPAPFVLGHALA